MEERIRRAWSIADQKIKGVGEGKYSFEKDNRRAGIG